MCESQGLLTCLKLGVCLSTLLKWGLRGASFRYESEVHQSTPQPVVQSVIRDQLCAIETYLLGSGVKLPVSHLGNPIVPDAPNQ